MQIEVGQLKELEPGKTYALQICGEPSHEKQRAISSSIRTIMEHHKIYFILFDENVKLIDAPAEVT